MDWLNYHLSFFNYVRENDNIWFVNERWNAIFKMNCHTYEPVYENFPVDNPEKGAAYSRIAKWKDTILLLPFSAKSPLYFIRNKIHKLVYLPEIMVNFKYGFRSVIQCENHLYVFFINRYYAYMDIDLNEETFKLRKWDKFPEVCNTDGYDVGITCIYKKKEIWSVIRDSSYVISFNIKDLTTNMYDMGADVNFDAGFQIKNGIGYALSNHGRKLVSFLIENPKSKSIKEIAAQLKHGYFDNFYITDDRLLLLPNGDMNISYVELSSSKTSYLDLPREFQWIEDYRYKRRNRFGCFECDGDKLVLYPRIGNGIIFINIKTSEVEFKELKINMYKIQTQLAKSNKLNKVEAFGDSPLILALVKQSDDSANNFKLKRYCGNRIYREIMDKL